MQFLNSEIYRNTENYIYLTSIPFLLIQKTANLKLQVHRSKYFLQKIIFILDKRAHSGDFMELETELEFLQFAMENLPAMVQLEQVVGEQLMPALAGLYTAALQLDLSYLSDELDDILQQSGLCQLTLVTLTDFSTGLEAQLQQLTAGGRRLAIHQLGSRIDNFKLRTKQLFQRFTSQKAGSGDGYSHDVCLYYFLVHFVEFLLPFIQKFPW